MDKGESFYNKAMTIWQDAESLDKQDVIDIILDVAEDVKRHGGKLGNDTINYIKISRLDEGLCPDCGSRLDYDCEIINTHEAWGGTFGEVKPRAECKSCGWESEA